MGRVMMKSGDLVENANPSISKLAFVLKEMSDLDGWCAGNECHQLANLWLSMVAGPAIDEQGAERRMRAMMETGRSTVGHQEMNESCDPNDLAPMAESSTSKVALPDDDDWDDDDSE